MASRQPVLFIGHGNPMNALADNDFSRTLRQLGEKLIRPRAILCISAHWLTTSIKITAMPKPRTIHDFYGFPQALFDVQYPAPGSPQIALEIKESLPKLSLELDQEWGLDHGAWSVLRHLYPLADIPVLQLSIPIHQSSSFQFEVGRQLIPLRDQGILIIGSGNIVHNLQKIQFSAQAPAYPWALQFNEWVQDLLDKNEFSTIVENSHKTPEGALSIPTNEHWYPFLQVLGAANKEKTHHIIYDGIENSSISMKSLLFP